jgi:hypothetical protein
MYLPGNTFEDEICCVVAEQLQPYGHVIALGAVCNALTEHTGEVSQTELIPAATAAAAAQACSHTSALTSPMRSWHNSNS